MTVTEVGCMGVKPDLDIMNDSTPEESKDPSKVWAFFDFESVEQHQQFAQEYGADAVKDIPKICTHGVFTKHVKLDPSSEVLGYAKAEVILVYFQDDITEDKQQALAVQVGTIFEQTFNHFPGVKGVACGWGVEKDFPAPNEDGKPRAVLMAVVGWETAEVQRDHSDKDDHQEAIGMIAGLEGSTSFDSFTINCRHLKRS